MAGRTGLACNSPRHRSQAKQWAKKQCRTLRGPSSGAYSPEWIRQGPMEQMCYERSFSGSFLVETIAKAEVPLVVVQLVSVIEGDAALQKRVPANVGVERGVEK